MELCFKSFAFLIILFFHFALIRTHIVSFFLIFLNCFFIISQNVVLLWCNSLGWHMVYIIVIDNNIFSFRSTDAVVSNCSLFSWWTFFNFGVSYMDLSWWLFFLCFVSSFLMCSLFNVFRQFIIVISFLVWLNWNLLI